MNFDRSKFKPAKTDAFKREMEKSKKYDKSFSIDNNGRIKHFFIKEGKNKFRLLPSFKEEEPDYRAIRSTLMKVEKDVWENGEKTGKKEIRLGEIFIATQHSGKLKKDPIELYISYLVNRMYKEYGKDEAKKKLKYIYGYRENGQWKPGIIPSTNYMFYATNEQGELGLVKLYDSMVNQMENINLEYQEDDDSLGDNIFTNPDKGHPIIIKKIKENNKWVFKVDEERLGKTQRWDDFYEEHRVPDDVLKALEKQPSLTEKYVNVYTTKDFDLAMDALKRFDDEHEYNVMDDDDFLDEIEELYSKCPKFEPKSLAKSKNTENDSQNAEKPTVTIMGMKKFLKQYVKEMYGEEIELPTLTIKEVKKWYSIAQKGEELPFEEKEISDSKIDLEEDNQPEIADDIADDISAKIAELRRKTDNN